MKIRHVEGLMYVKFVEALCPQISVVWQFVEWVAGSCVTFVIRLQFRITRCIGESPLLCALENNVISPDAQQRELNAEHIFRQNKMPRFL
ncbi:hypothetical protein TNCV_2281061 [Trichonephila clavipes]|nr:hypothetical protein TNCV_2281061 [Trichonephila clavipes]